MFDRRLVQYYNWSLLGIILLLGLIGLITLFSAVTTGKDASQQTLYAKQLIWYCSGLTIMVALFLFDYKLLDRWASLIYVVCIILLILVLFFGKYVAGSKRWLVIGPISIQPSELVKIAVVIILARYYSKWACTKGLTLRELIYPSILTLIPFALIVRQPDLGTAMLVLLLAASITIFVKIEKKSLCFIFAVSMIVVPMVWLFLKEYQQQRILTFLNPERDPLGAGYHIIQSKIAIGSGMIFGKGFLKGTQNVLSFLPEQHTDFVFSVMAEEWGFVGSFVLLGLFMALILQGLSVAYNCRDPFGVILSTGLTMMIFWQVIINIGMVMGLLPVVGIPLPFISYGGSSIIATMICVGILMNISMRRFMFE